MCQEDVMSVTQDTEPSQRATCCLFRGLRGFLFVPCWLSVEVLVWLWGDCCLTVGVAVGVITIVKLGLVL